ncbi:MAG: hypothetical protein Kow00120_10790 [Anaerolineae bacterium]
MDTRTCKRTLFTLFVMAAVLLGAFPAAAQTETTLLVAFIGADSGSQAATDQLLYQAAVLAAEQINSSGAGLYAQGVTGPDGARYRFEVLYYPADTDSGALDALADAVADGAIAVLGPDPAGRVRAILNAGTPALPLLYGAPDAPDGGGTGDYAFHLAADYADWAEAAADYLVNERLFSKVAVAAVDAEAVQSSVAVFTEAVEDAGAEVVANLMHTASADDLLADAREIGASGADALFAWTLDAQAARLAEALQTIGWDGVALYAGMGGSFVELAGAAVASGAYGVVGWTPAAYDALSQSFVDAYSARWGSAPPDHAAAYFDAMYLLAEAVRDAGSDPDAIASALDGSADYYGVQGDYDGAETSGLRVIQVNATGALVEAALYVGGVCANCPDIWSLEAADADAGRAVATLALIATLDGPAEARGRQAEQAAALAVREINNAGGVIDPDGVRYMLFLQSYSATTADEAANSITAAASAGARAVLGPDYNALIKPNLSLAAQAGVPLLTTATDSWIPNDDPTDYVFQVRANDAAAASAAAAYLLDVRGLTDFATVSVRADYALNAVDALTQVIVASGDGRVVRAVEHDLDEDDFATIASQIVASGAQSVLAWTTPTAATRLLDALGAQGWTGVYVYGYLTPELVDTLDAPAGIELLGAASWWPAGASWASQRFTESYVARYGETPGPQSAAYYDAVYLIAHAISEAGSAPADIQAWLAETGAMVGVQGVYQPATYGQGETTRSVMLVRVDAAGVHAVARYEGTVCMGGCGEVAMGVAPALVGAIETASTEETYTTTTVAYNPLDIYPTYQACNVSGPFNYVCTGWINVQGGLAPYTVWIDGREAPNTDGASELRVEGPKCAIKLYDVEVEDANGQTYKESFAIDPAGNEARFFPGGRCR